MKLKLRQDERQWLIYQEESVIPAVRALEVLALLLAGPTLIRHPKIELRALGTMMMKLGQHREMYMLGTGQGEPTDLETVAGRHLATIIGELAGVANGVEARDELHAALYWLDSTLNKAGIKGTGWPTDAAMGRR